MRPVSPDEADEGQQREHEDEYQHHLARINKHLISGGRAVDRHGIPQLVLDRLIQSYRGAGWDVELVADFRDGDFLRFSRSRW